MEFSLKLSVPDETPRSASAVVRVPFVLRSEETGCHLSLLSKCGAPVKLFEPSFAGASARVFAEF